MVPGLISSNTRSYIPTALYRLESIDLSKVAAFQPLNNVFQPLFIPSPIKKCGTMRLA